MSEDVQRSILKQYDERVSMYTSFSNKLENLLKDLLNNAGISEHSVNSRVKSKESLRGKLARADKQYADLSEITDLIGLRVITYLADDVDTFAEFVKQQFVIDSNNSVDKRELTEPDRFGYVSLHQVVELSSSRVDLPEYEAFSGLKAEIQIRSILQHTWAEIEHDLGYKSAVEVPARVRRRFSRLAGLLELADEEFQDIQKELSKYETQVPEYIKNTPAEVSIDKASIETYIKNSPVSNDIDTKIVSKSGANYSEGILVASRLSIGLPMLNIHSIQELEVTLSEKQSRIVEYGVKWLANAPWRSGNNVSISKGAGIIFCVYLLLAEKTQDREYVEDFLRKTIPQYQEQLGEHILQTYLALEPEGG